MESDIEIEIILSGKVQGVFMRDYIRNRANELGVRGVARNLDDGSVEVIAQGERAALEEFVRRVKQGSIHSHVESAEVNWYDTPGDHFEGFSIE